MNKTNISPEEYLKQSIKVWCHNRNQWETDELAILESGDFIDRKNRLHRKKNHTAYVTLDDALAAIKMTEEALLADTEEKHKEIGPFTWDEAKKYLAKGHKVRSELWDDGQFLAKDCEGFYDETDGVRSNYVGVSSEAGEKGWFVLLEEKE